MRPEKIRMWRAAEELIVEIDVIVARVRSQAANSAYHLERSGESVLFNIAEGVGAYPPKVKIAAYEVAKKEASEVRAVLRRLVLRRLVTSREVERALNLASTIMVMLLRAIRTLRERA
jgi:four helix bundle protein